MSKLERNIPVTLYISFSVIAEKIFRKIELKVFFLLKKGQLGVFNTHKNTTLKTTFQQTQKIKLKKYSALSLENIQYIHMTSLNAFF